MSLFIMQKHQRPPSQDFAGASNESTRDQAIGIDRLAVAIDVQTRSSFLPNILVLGFPHMGRPGAKGGSERFRPIGFGELARDPARYGNTRRLDTFLSPLLTHLRCILVGHAFDASCEDGRNSSVSSWRRQCEELESRDRAVVGLHEAIAVSRLASKPDTFAAANNNSPPAPS